MADVTLNDVARKSGVSRATASRALNGRDGVRPDVRERVAIVAESLGYRPNRSAQNLAGGRSSVIGFVLNTDELYIDVYGSSLMQAVVRAADRHNEGLMLLMDKEEPNVAVRNLLRDGLIDGVIVSAVAIGQRWVEQLLDAQVPTVLVGAHPRRSDVHVIDVENKRSSANLVEFLLNSAGPRVATVTGPLERVDASLRLEGYRAAHETRGLDVDEELVVAGDFSFWSGYEAADALLDVSPDAIFCANDEMALGLIRRAEERGIDVPSQLSVAGFDGTSSLERYGRKVTSVRQPFDVLANTAVESLVTLIEGGTVPLHIPVDPEVFGGDTTQPYHDHPNEDRSHEDHPQERDVDGADSAAPPTTSP